MVAVVVNVVVEVVEAGGGGGRAVGGIIVSRETGDSAKGSARASWHGTRGLTTEGEGEITEG